MPAAICPGNIGKRPSGSPVAPFPLLNAPGTKPVQRRRGRAHNRDRAKMFIHSRFTCKSRTCEASPSPSQAHRNSEDSSSPQFASSELQGAARLHHRAACAPQLCYSLRRPRCAASMANAYRTSQTSGLLTPSDMRPDYRPPSPPAAGIPRHHRRTTTPPRAPQQATEAGIRSSAQRQTRGSTGCHRLPPATACAKQEAGGRRAGMCTETNALQNGAYRDAGSSGSAVSNLTCGWCFA